MTIPTPEIPREVVIVPGTDVDDAWERYQPFEPLHFQQDILNPMSDAELERVMEALAVRPGMRLLDIACGHGEMLLRFAQRYRIDAIGLDESPWVIVRAAQRTARRRLVGTVRWWLGSGTEAPRGPFDVVTCIGASWIWHGFAGTVAAVGDRVRPGGRVAVGDLRARDDVDGPPGILTRRDQIAVIEAAGLVPIGEFVSADASWTAYQQRILANAEAYALATPGDPLRDRRQMAAEWLDDHRRDRERLVWSVWVAERPR